MVSGQVAVTRSSPLELRSAGGHALVAVGPIVADVLDHAVVVAEGPETLIKPVVVAAVVAELVHSV